MQTNVSGKFPVALLLSAAMLTACDNSKSPKPEPEPDPPFIVEGRYVQASYDPEDGESLLLSSSTNQNGRTGASNLLRWNLETGANAGLRTSYDYEVEERTGHLMYARNGNIWGAALQSRNFYFMMGPESGITMAVQRPDADTKLSDADLEGRFYCVRMSGKPRRLSEGVDKADREQQWFRRAALIEANFNGAGAFSYTILHDSSGTLDTSMSYDGTYRLDEEGRLTILTDEYYSADGVVVGEKEELVWGGGYQHKDQLLSVAYAVGDREPTTEERLNPGTSVPPEEADSLGIMACLKGVDGATTSALSGQYWFGRLNQVSVKTEATGAYTDTYNGAYGYLAADANAGTAQRVECQSRSVLRTWDLNYWVNNDGYVELSDGSTTLKGVVGASGDVALLMHSKTTARTGQTETEFGIDILTKKHQEGACPQR